MRKRRKEVRKRGGGGGKKEKGKIKEPYCWKKVFSSHLEERISASINKKPNSVCFTGIDATKLECQLQDNIYFTRVSVPHFTVVR